jgi:tellurite resistance protein
MLADGRIRKVERKFLDQALKRLGAAPLEEGDLRVWRPTELGAPKDPAAVIAAMRALALCDNEADGSERRVLEEFARAWGVALPADPLPRPGAMAELGRALRRLLG